MVSYHQSVLLEETVDFLSPCFFRTGGETQYVIDTTLGMGGHTLALLLKHNNIFIKAVDADYNMIQHAKQRLSQQNNDTNSILERVSFHNMWFDKFLEKCSKEQNKCNYSAILMDLGLCMYHFKESSRGFSRFSDDKLDMRLHTTSETDGKLFFDNNEEVKAYDIISTYDEQELANIFFCYGEERSSREWARRIVEYRKDNEIKTVKNLLSALQLGKKPSDGKIIARIFQALRICVNDELTRLERALPLAWDLLSPGGRLAVISFHSLEDRIVKKFFKSITTSFKNNKYKPITRSSEVSYNMLGETASIKDKNGILLTKKPVLPTQEELMRNSASRSAKLRVVEKRTV